MSIHVSGATRIDPGQRKRVQRDSRYADLAEQVEDLRVGQQLIVRPDDNKQKQSAFRNQVAAALRRLVVLRKGQRLRYWSHGDGLHVIVGKMKSK